ncbi:MFS transporter [Glycomyces albidus]|nr:MFS transporter [Glycomyces albidus]
MTTTLPRPRLREPDTGECRRVLAVLLLSVFLLSATVSLANVAVPTTAADLDASLTQMMWVVNGYLLAFAALLPLAGRLGDHLGPRRALAIGLLLVAAASAVCALAPNPSTLVAARALQGIGAALVTPQTLTILTRTFPPERRGRALGAWGMVAGLAVATGPALGGLITEHLDWRWVYGGIGLWAAAALACTPLLPRLPSARTAGLDLTGAVLLAALLAAAVHLLLEGVPEPLRRLLGPAALPAALAVLAALTAAVALQQRRRQSRDPLVPFAVLRAHQFLLMAVTTGALSCAVAGMVLVTVVQLRTVAGLGPTQAGLLIALGPAVSVPFAVLSGRLTDRHGGRGPILAGLGSMSAGLFALSGGIAAGPHWALLLPGLVVFGVGMGVVFAPPTVLAMAHVPQSLTGAAAGAMSTLRILGFAVGSAAVSAVLQAGLANADANADLAQTLQPTDDPALREGIAAATSSALLLPALLLAALAVGCLYGTGESSRRIRARNRSAGPIGAPGATDGIQAPKRVRRRGGLREGAGRHH